MSRNVEGATIVAASVLAAFGVTLVNFANDGNLDAQTALTFLVFLIAFGGLHVAVRRWAPRATPLLVPPIAALTAIGFFEIYRLDPVRGGLQRWWLLIAAGLAVLALALLSTSTTAILRRYRNITLLISLILLLLPNLPSDWAVPLKGLEVNGSRLWVVLDVGFTSLQFQPAELAKLGLVAYIAAYLADHQRRIARETSSSSGPSASSSSSHSVTWGRPSFCSSGSSSSYMRPRARPGTSWWEG